MEKYLITHFDIHGREPILRRMKDGTLVCSFLTGGVHEPRNENVFTIARSFDDGRTWTKPEVIHKHSWRGLWCTEIFTECENPFAVIHSYNAPSHYRELQTFRSFPDESGEKWSEPESIRGTINGCSIRQGFRLSNGDILFPLYWQEVPCGFDWPDKPNGWNTQLWPFVTGVGISTDDCKTIYRYGDLRCEGRPLWEPNAFELEDGHIIMYMRAGNPVMYISESFDYGRTWSEPVPSDIPNPNTKITTVKINGQIVMINNFCSGSAARLNLCIAKSTDGKHFEKVAQVEPENEEWFYPHAYVDHEQKILYVAYENKVDHYLKKYTFEELGL